MTGYDGYVVIKTKLDTSGIDNSISSLKKGLESKADGLGRTLTSPFTMLKAAIIHAGVDIALKLIVNQMDEAIRRVDALNNFPNVMSNLGISTEEATAAINYMSDRLVGLPTTLDAAALAVQRLTSANGNVQASTEMFLALNNAILAGGASTQLQASALEQMSQAYAKGKPDMMEWRTALMAMPAQLAQVANVMGFASSNALGEAMREGRVSMNEFMIALTEMNAKSINGFKTLEEQAFNATGGIKTSLTNLKTAISRGLANIMNEIGQANIASVFKGIINWINKTANYIAAFIRLIMTAINFIIKLFGGKGLNSKKTKKDTKQAGAAIGSVGDNAESAAGKMDKAGKSAKKLRKDLKQLAAFDEMNVLQEKDKTGSNSGKTGDSGGGGGDVDLSNFDLSGLDPKKTKSKIDEIYDKMIQFIKNIGKAFKKLNFNLGFEIILYHLKNIANAMKAIFKDETVLASIGHFQYQIKQSFIGIIGDIIVIGTNIVEGFVGAIDEYLRKNRARVQGFIVSLFTSAALMGQVIRHLLDVLATISQVFTSLAAKKIGSNIIAMFVNPFMSVIKVAGQFVVDLSKVFIEPLYDNMEELQATIQNALEPIRSITKSLADAFTYLGDKLEELYSDYMHPFFEAVQIGLSDTFGKFLKVYNRDVVPFLKKVASDFDKLWKNNLKPFFDEVTAYIGETIKYLQVLWENGLKPIIDWTITNVIPVIVPILKVLWTVFKTVVGVFIDGITAIMNFFKNLVVFLRKFANADFKGAMDALKKAFTEPFIIAQKTITRTIEDLKKAINNKIKNIKDDIKGVFSWSYIKKQWDEFTKNWKTNLAKLATTITLRVVLGSTGKLVSDFGKLIEKLSKKSKVEISSKSSKGGGGTRAKGGIFYPSKLPKLAVGGIINMPGRGVPYNGATIGERGAEAVVPLTDSQQMALLGEAIGRYITINNNITTTLNGRVLSRELKKTMNESNFATNN